MTSNGELLLFVAFLAAPFVMIIVALISRSDIGPKWLSDLLHRYERWTWGDASPFFPVDPYTPLEQLNDVPQTDSKKFPPMRERMNNAGMELLITIVIGVFVGLALLHFLSML